MSQENVEVVRRIFEEDEEGLFDRHWERILDFWEPRGDYYPVEDLPRFSSGGSPGSARRTRALGLSGETLEAVGLSEQDAHADS